MESRGRRSSDGAARHPRARRRADDQAIIDLLDTVREVRTALAIDLSAAAGALDENEPEVARDILAAAAADLERADKQVHDSGPGELAARRRRRRTLIALPAVPLVGAIAMTAAAAISAATHQPSPSSAQHHAVVSHVSATTTLQRLEHVVKHDPRAAQVIAVSDHLHQQLTQMIASIDDPAQLHIVQHLLTLEQRVLERSRIPGTELALAASRELTELLKQQPVHVRTKHAVATQSSPTTTPATRAKPSAKPTPTHRQEVPQPTQTSAPSHQSPSPNPSNGLFGQGVLNQSR